MTLIQADAIHLPYRSNYFHAIVTSPPYYGLRKYSGEQGERPLGLEDTAEEHIERMVVIFREVRRVLRDDGVCWINYGDAFDDGNLMMLPHRLAIALQDDGWIVRNDLVWFKRNPMPESVAGWRWERKRKIVGDDPRGGEDYRDNAHGESPQRKHDGSDFAQPEYEYGDDYVLRKSSWRHTRQHEYVFMLVKKMGYQCNQEVVREKGVYSEKELAQQMRAHIAKYKRDGPIDDDSPRKVADMGRIGSESNVYIRSGRNPRSVLDVPTAPYKGAHYATFPPKLIAPLIRASVPRRCCPECGMAWAPVVEKSEEYTNRLASRGHFDTGSFGKMVKAKRESEGTSRADLVPLFIDRYKNAESVKAQISNWELGKNVPNDIDYIVLKEELGLDESFDEQLASYRDVKHGLWGEAPEELVAPSAAPAFANGTTVTDYRPTCECGVTEHEPGIVLDIFGGSGTTGMVAKELLRRWVVMDISRPYLDEQAKVRTGSGTPSKALEGLPMFGDEDETE